MKTMLGLLGVLLFLGCVTVDSDPGADPARNKPILGKWVAIDQNNTTLVFTQDPKTKNRALTLTVGDMVGHGVWIYVNNSLMASIPDMKDGNGNIVNNTEVFGEITGAGHLLLTSAGVNVEFQRPGKAPSKPR